ncbi:TetR/AcrR family transcriptional regulator [Amycolatopsis sp. 3B14]|uniref:TetR/AcrR family transcriptional regulator n=1 Tax=Amycolatopsis sp. 3B14 TaxID=3243600 RepID=UPI003D99F082
MSSDEGRRRRGRPVSPEVDERIRHAALALLREGGYGKLTFDALATRAGVSRNSLYRRWTSKAELVFDVVFSGAPDLVVPDTGSLGGDLAAIFAAFADDFGRPEVAAVIGGLIADSRGDGDLRERFVARVDAATRDALGEVARRARGRGERVPDDVEALTHLLVGAAMYRTVVLGADPGPVLAVLEALVSGS